MTTIETVVTFLEMRAKHLVLVPVPAIPKLMLMRAESPSVGFYRYLYDAVGRDYYWVDRKRLADAELAAIIQEDRVQVWVTYVAGQPAGYFEVDAREAPGQVELAYLGLTPAFHGLGLGKWMLAEAIRACWAGNPQRVVVETCTLDGPGALSLYQKMGFVPYDRQDKIIEVGD